MGETHEKENKDYLAKKIAEEIAKLVLKVNIDGYDRWFAYEIEVRDPTPYKEWDYVVCTPFTLNLKDDMGCYANEIDILEITCEDGIKIAWEPGRVGDMWFPKIIPKGATFKLENKKISHLIIHALSAGEIKIEVEGAVDC